MSSPERAVETQVVLVRPHYAGNVGAAARAAANFGVRRLLLVAPRCSLEEPEFVKMAMGGRERVEVRAVASLEEAVAGAHLAVATTSGRARDPRPLHRPDQLRDLLARAAVPSLALVFGPERGGLSTQELRACPLRLSVPTHPDFPVLNLAQAVAVVLALLAAPAPPPRPRSPLDLPAPVGEFTAAVAHLGAALLATGFLDPVNPERTLDQVRRLLARATPTARELAILRGIASHVLYLGSRMQPGAASPPSPNSSAAGSRPVTRRNRAASPSTAPAGSSRSRRSTR